jgi:glucose/arabinose dehydrogenase/N-acetylneuraminic acid mutarotase
MISFTGGDGGIPDGSGTGTGFTMVDPPTSPGNPLLDPDAPGYWADRLSVDTGTGKLTIAATPGIQYQNNNNLDNALGVGLNLPSAAITLETALSDLPAGPGGWAQAGLWFGGAGNFGRGTSEDNYIKLVVGSPSSGNYVLQVKMELAGAAQGGREIALPSSPGTISLKLVANPVDRSVQARYNLGAGEQIFHTFTGVPDEWFSFDQAGIDPSVATRSYGGIFATRRNASVPVNFSFDMFSVTQSAASGGDGSFEFGQWTIPVPSPTGMVVGPDDRLYVTEILGTVHAITLDHVTRSVVDDQVINTVRSTHGGNRLTLGIAVDPASTPEDVVLWVSHSSGSINNGAENSGVVSRLSGTDFSSIEDRITGLPRAIANHAINNVRFGPDGKLYIAAGGNTGAGAPNLEPTEFGDRPEQPLSAAILVADVNNPAFQGDCATPVGQFGIPATCDVAVYASGLRNPYDLFWHHNGALYAPDNGLGVTGTYPPFPSPPCTGLADASTNNPGTQADLLYRVEQGKYYGHPNPYRNECVFKDGSYQGVAPLPNYQLPLFNLGNNRSADGIIEYQGDAFYSRLMGQLLISNYSSGDDITRIKLSSDGTGVVNSASLIGGFQEPLPLAQDTLGNIYVGELTAQQVTVLVPLPLFPAPAGDWAGRQPLPEALLDPGGTALDDRFYLVAGKTASSHVSGLYIYNPVTNSWSTGPDLPGPAVENPAVVGMDGKLYVIGGSTAPFSGSVSNAAVFDPVAASWTSLPPMTTGRGGPTAQVLDGKIHVVGGLASDGASLASVEVYDPVTNSWSAGVPMQTRRDNPGSAVFNDRLYVFGGRTRNADGSSDDPTLNSVEVFDPVANTWSFASPMPTGRRAMVVGTISGRAQVMGGESPVIAENEEYDPVTDSWRTLTPMSVPRHGAAGATIRGSVYVAGGGPTAGSSFSSVNEVFAY